MRIRIPDPDSGSGLFPKFNRVFLVQGYIYDKIFIKIRSLWKYEPNSVKMPYLTKFLDPEREADDSQNLISSAVCTAQIRLW